MPGGADGALVCPGCGAVEPASERLCPHCGSLLTLTPAEHAAPVSAARERARKVRPEYASGPLIKVAGGRHQAEAEFVAGLLLEEGIPSLIRRSAGFDVPDYLAAGPRDVLVPASGVDAARDVLLQTGLAPSGPVTGPAPWRVLAALLLGLALIVVVGWLGGLL